MTSRPWSAAAPRAPRRAPRLTRRARWTPPARPLDPRRYGSRVIADGAAVAHFERSGWVLLDVLGAQDVDQRRVWVDEVASWPDGGGEWLHYREMTDDGPKLCRTENFVPFHGGLRALLCAGEVLGAASALLGEPAVLYKEKINYK